MSRRRQRTHRLDHAWPHYLHRLTLPELASFIAELNLGVQPVVRSVVCAARSWAVGATNLQTACAAAR